MTQPIRYAFVFASVVCILVNLALLQGYIHILLGLLHYNQSSDLFSQCLPTIDTMLMETNSNSSKVDTHTATTPTTIITNNSKNICICELISTDCLDSIRCLPETKTKSRELIVKGVLTREVMKNQSTFSKHNYWAGSSPVGKATQYLIQASWLGWISEQGDLPDVTSRQSLFINDTLYPYCRKKRLKGRDCFFTKPSEPEELGDFEAIAMDKMANGIEENSAGRQMIHSIQSELQEYVNRTRTDRNALPGLSHLLSFANVGRILFNRQPNVRRFCHRVHSYVNGSITPSKLASTMTLPLSDDALTVSMHLRRADSCDHLEKPFAPVASSLDSHAQPTNLRKCYATHVYLNELRRVQDNMPVHRQSMEVFLSTDDSTSVMQDIQSLDMEFFQSITWHVLDISRDVFNYDGVVEGNRHSKHASLGESAVADLWLLSHGEVFIGHLGSRFGKVGWILATSRYQRFVPFFSVDGHSVCCEIDEPCGAVKPYIRSMENCLTFAHEFHDGVSMNPGYWEFGSLKRIMDALQDDTKVMLQEEESLTTEKE